MLCIRCGRDHKQTKEDVSHSTLFCVTKRYPRVNPNDRYDVDKRVVQLEIETSEPLSDEFYDALANLLSAYCG
jgi:hypothetical protein